MDSPQIISTIALKPLANWLSPDAYKLRKKCIIPIK